MPIRKSTFSPKQVLIMYFLITLSLVFSLFALLGCIWRTAGLRREIDELKATLVSKDDNNSFGKDISATLVSSKNPIKDRYTLAVLSGIIDPKEVSIFDFYKNCRLVPPKEGSTVGDRIKTEDEYKKMLNQKPE